MYVHIFHLCKDGGKELRDMVQDVLAGRCAGQLHLAAAEFGGALIKVYFMPPEGRCISGFTACGTAADHGHMLFDICPADALRVSGLSARQGIDGAAQGVIVPDAHADTVVAAHAAADTLALACLQLVGKIWIRDQGTRKGNIICFALFQNTFRILQILHAAGDQHRNADSLPDLSGITCEHAFFVVDRREHPCHDLLCAACDINGVHTCIFQHLCQFHSIFDLSSLFADPVICGEADDNGHYGAVDPAHLRDQLQEEPGPVGKASAVFVVPVIEKGREELGDQVSRVGVDGDCIKASLFCTQGALAVGPDKLMDLLHTQPADRTVCDRTADLAGTDIHGLIDAGAAGLIGRAHGLCAAAGCEQDRDLCSLQVDCFRQLGHHRNVGIVIQPCRPGVGIDGIQLRAGLGLLGDDQPYAALCAPGIVIDLRPSQHTVRCCEMRLCRRHNDPVSKIHSADRSGFQ